MTLRIGDILVLSGVLTEQQRDRVLEEQRLTARPFGLLAERLFGVDPAAVESAWAAQFAEAAGVVDPRDEVIDPLAAEVISSRQAWQFRVLPLRFEHDELIVCTTRRDLPRAIRFVSSHLRTPSAVVVTDPVSLGKALEERYPVAGFDADELASDFINLDRHRRSRSEGVA
ncbi:MAG: hypothetical protein AAF108_04945 [Planctomycetota bacterium]